MSKQNKKTKSSKKKSVKSKSNNRKCSLLRKALEAVKKALSLKRKK